MNMNIKKSRYTVPKCVALDVQADKLMAISVDKLPVDPETPGIPAAREERDSNASVWGQEW